MTTKEQLIKEFREKFPLVWNSRRREHVSIPDTVLEKAFDFAFDAGRASGIEEVKNVIPRKTGSSSYKSQGWNEAVDQMRENIKALTPSSSKDN